LQSVTGQTNSKQKLITGGKTASVKSNTEVKKDSFVNPYYIIIDKKNYSLELYDDTGWLYTYPVVFGSREMGDKMIEGDKKTPDGEYKIILKKTHKVWGVELLLDYPNEQNIKLFNERKAKGLIPKKGKIGNGIAIHGTMPDSDWTVDRYINWTDGCISLKSADMKELFDLVPEGTKVTIHQ
jgi:murein L,D-transpeptidase YafK